MFRFPRIVSSWLGALAALAVLAYAGPGSAETGDVLGPGDGVRVTVFQNPDLTTETRVAADGTIRMPLIGDVNLNGLSSGDAADRIAQRLKDGQFLNDPQVAVTLLQVRSRQVSVLGQVAKPGRYAIEDPGTRVTDVLALAGGITPTGDDTVTVVTKRDGKPTKISVDVAGMYRNVDMAANVAVDNGDTIYVDRAPVFYIYGEVQRPGSYRLEKDLSVVQALSLGGGVTLRGTERGIKISRRAPDGTLVKFEVQPGDKVRADDVIYVSESWF